MDEWEDKDAAVESVGGGLRPKERQKKGRWKWWIGESWIQEKDDKSRGGQNC